ncbi:hypothetical protein, partial [Bradyrhizobium sp. ORS 375]|uniref:hypothetical protein n=1 Tax=Bradyrhizobium sp. (strain ORS 375) TaxID=566679 RepID=UPI001AEC513A
MPKLFVRASVLTRKPTRPSHPALSVRDDRDTPLLLRGGTGGNVKVICPTVQARIVRQTNTTGSSRMMVMRKMPVGQNGGV